MAPSKKAAGIELTSRDTTRLVVVLVATAILVASFFAPWWTRGMSFDYNEDDNPRGLGEVALDQPAYSYGPFSTPGIGGATTDASRAAAVAVLGIGFLLTTFFASGGLAVRALVRADKIQVGPDVAVRLSIAAFLVGVFTVVWAAFFLPLLGNNPGWLYGSEIQTPITGFEGAEFIEDVRYANAGFFLGIVGLVLYPAYLWSDAATSRAAKNPVPQDTATTGATAA